MTAEIQLDNGQNSNPPPFLSTNKWRHEALRIYVVLEQDLRFITQKTEERNDYKPSCFEQKILR